jgi:medium-chain acyl-[acyl-carrier-protein] hydrolase
MDFSRNYLVHYYEADSSRRLTLPALVQYFEDIAILDSASKGFGLSYFDETKTGWLLLKWEIDIARLPLYDETIKVATRVHAMKKFLADREFSIYDKNGAEIVTARSNWLFADAVKRRPLRIGEDMQNRYQTFAESESEFIAIDEVSCITPIDENSQSEVFRAAIKTVYSDIDTNRHVNNVRYIAWALDTLPAEIVQNAVPVSLRVQYKKELNLGEEAEVLSLMETNSPEDMRSHHTIKRSDDELCSMEICWKQC